MRNVARLCTRCVTILIGVCLVRFRGHFSSQDYNKKAKKTIVIGKLMTTPLEKTDADTIMLAAEWDGLSPTQIKA